MSDHQDDYYPCDGHDCYDRGNFHVSCSACPLYKHKNVFKKEEKNIDGGD